MIRTYLEHKIVEALLINILQSLFELQREISQVGQMGPTSFQIGFFVVDVDLRIQAGSRHVRRADRLDLTDVMKSFFVCDFKARF